SRPQNPKTGQAPAIRNTIPVTKLAPPSTNISARKPLRPSERCGVSTAEKIVGSRAGSLSRTMALIIPKVMARRTSRKPVRSPTRKAAGKPVEGLRRARAGKAARVKGPKKRAAADVTAAAGKLPQMPQADIEEAFRRFQAARPEPRGELEHVNPFT